MLFSTKNPGRQRRYLREVVRWSRVSVLPNEESVVPLDVIREAVVQPDSPCSQPVGSWAPVPVCYEHFKEVPSEMTHIKKLRQLQL